MKRNKDPQLCKEILELATKEELCAFIMDQLDGNHWMQTDIYLEFLQKVPQRPGKMNKYKPVIQELFIDQNFDDLIDEIPPFCNKNDHGTLHLDTMDQWLRKAKYFSDVQNYTESILICQAILDVFSSWFYTQKKLVQIMINSDYYQEPIDILKKLLPNINKEELNDLFNYCQSEILQPKYISTTLNKHFKDLLTQISMTREM